MKEVSSKLFNFEIDPTLLENFKAVAKKQNRSAGGALRQMIQEAVEKDEASK